MTWTQDDFLVTDDPVAVDVDFVHALLKTTYWAEHRSREVVEASFRSPACIPFMGLAAGKPTGFARVVTDRCTFAWVCDVVVHPDHRGKRRDHSQRFGPGRAQPRDGAAGQGAADRGDPRRTGFRHRSFRIADHSDLTPARPELSKLLREPGRRAAG